MYDNHYQDCRPLETNLDRWLDLAKRDRLRVMLHKNFNHLSRECQNFLILCHGTDLTRAEIGLVCGCTQKQVYQEAKRAKRNLLKNLATTLKIEGNSLQTSDCLVDLDTFIEAELPSQIQKFFRDRIQGIYQSLDAERKKSLASAFFSEEDNR